MPTIFPGAGLPAPVATPLAGILPPQVSASPQAGVMQAEPLLSVMPPALTQGEAAGLPGQDDTEEAVDESCPQQLLALLLAAPVAAAPAGGAAPIPAQTTEGHRVTGAPHDRVPTNPVGGLRNSLMTAGRPPVAEPVTAIPPRHEAAGVTVGDQLTVRQDAASPRPVPADSPVSHPLIKPVRQEPGQPLSADSTPLNPAPALVNALIKSEAAAGKLPTIVLPAAPDQRADALQKALTGRMAMQIDRHEQKATIRLDPPHLGKVDISIHFESGKLQVQIQAAQPEVTRLLQQVSHEMRASLSEQNNVQVNVQVSTQSGDSRQQQRHRDRPETAIANNNEEVTTPQRGADGTILTTV